MGKLQFKRGLKSNLPTSADVGTPLWCTDTNELYIGTGTGVEKVGSSSSSSNSDSGSSSGSTTTASVSYSYDSENQRLIFGGN